MEYGVIEEMMNNEVWSMKNNEYIRIYTPVILLFYIKSDSFTRIVTPAISMTLSPIKIFILNVSETITNFQICSPDVSLIFSILVIVEKRFIKF